MKTKLYADYKVLRAIEHASNISQRLISKQTGINLSSVNYALKRLIKKGYIKISYMEKKKILYHLTPSGIAQKSKLAYSFFTYNYSLFSDIKNIISHKFTQKGLTGKNCAIFGLNEITEIAYLCLKSNGCHFISVFEDDKRLIGVKCLEGIVLPAERIEEDNQIHYIVNLKTEMKGTLCKLEIVEKNKFLLKQVDVRKREQPVDGGSVQLPEVS